MGECIDWQDSSSSYSSSEEEEEEALPLPEKPKLTPPPPLPPSPIDSDRSFVNKRVYKPKTAAKQTQSRRMPAKVKSSALPKTLVKSIVALINKETSRAVAGKVAKPKKKKKASPPPRKTTKGKSPAKKKKSPAKKKKK